MNKILIEIKNLLLNYFSLDPTPFVGELTDPEACHVH